MEKDKRRKNKKRRWWRKRKKKSIKNETKSKISPNLIQIQESQKHSNRIKSDKDMHRSILIKFLENQRIRKILKANVNGINSVTADSTSEITKDRRTTHICVERKELSIQKSVPRKNIPQK